MMSDIFPCSTPEEEVHITNSYKDITLYDIYVEDHGREDWYSVLLSAIFNCHISKSHIKALNGKRDVIKKYNELKGQLGNLFIVDADFDVLFGDADYIESNLFCWGHYNIESLLFNASAILDMIYIYRGDKYETIENNLRLKSWEETTYALLEKLFLTYACVRLMDSTRETTGISSDEYISGGQLDDKKIMDYICQIQSEFTNYDTIYKDVQQKYITNLGQSKARLICGKYILHTLQRFLSSKRYNFSYKTIIKYLSMHINPINFTDFREKVMIYLEEVTQS